MTFLTLGFKFFQWKKEARDWKYVIIFFSCCKTNATFFSYCKTDSPLNQISCSIKLKNKNRAWIKRIFKDLWDRFIFIYFYFNLAKQKYFVYINPKEHQGVQMFHIFIQKHIFNNNFWSRSNPGLQLTFLESSHWNLSFGTNFILGI